MIPTTAPVPAPVARALAGTAPAAPTVPWRRREWTRQLGLMLAVGAAYLVGAEISWQALGASSPGFAFFPPAGVSLAALVVSPRRRWPAVLIAVAIAESIADLTHGLALGVTLLYVLANTIEPLVGAGTLLRITGGRRDLDTRADFAAFLAAGCLLGPLVGGLVGVVAHAVEGGDVSVAAVAQWIAGDGVAVLAIGAPIILLVRHPRILVGRRLELAAMCVITAAAGWALFRTSLPPFLPMLPFFAWGAFRLGRVGISVTGAVFALTANAMTAAGYDMFSAVSASPTAERALTQLYLAILLVMLWLVAFATEDRLRAFRAALEARGERDDAQAVSDALQRAVSPSASGRVGDFSIGARYEPAEQVVGGDWYDAIALDDGVVCFAIGDVVGHGLAAVDDMTQLRFAARTLAMEGHGPARILAELSRLTERFTGGGFATTAIARFDPATMTLQYAGAGHPPLLVLRGDGAVDSVDSTGPPLGVGEPATWSERDVTVGAGDVFVLYTDGLIERRGVHLDDGLRELRVAVGAAMPGADLVAACGSVIDRTLAGRPREDDTCVLAFRYRPDARAAFAARVAVAVEPTR